jgi:hypothetical protein
VKNQVVHVRKLLNNTSSKKYWHYVFLFFLLDLEKFVGLLIGLVPTIMYTLVCMHALMDQSTGGGNSRGGVAAVAYTASADLCSKEVS